MINMDILCSLPPARRFIVPWMTMMLSLATCSSSSLGSLQLQLHTTPPPDDVSLSPLRDPGVIAFELRDAQSDQLFARARIDPQASAGAMTTMAGMSQADFGLVEPWGQRDIKFLAQGTFGQVLGQALSRNLIWNAGDTVRGVLELRRPLFLFGGGAQLVPRFAVPNPTFAPTRSLDPLLSEGGKLRVLDPNTVVPLLSDFDRTFDPPDGMTGSPVSAVAATKDGLSVLVITQQGRLHIVDTLSLTDSSSVSLMTSGLPVQSLEIDQNDTTAVATLYRLPVASTGLIGKLLFITNLPALRNGSGSAIITIDTMAGSSFGPPISATYAPDGLVDVLFAIPPLADGQPDCITLSGSNAELIRYYPHTGTVYSREKLSYTTSISYTSAGERVLTQPCKMAPGGVRSGSVVIEKSGEPLQLFAPGVASVLVAGSTISVIGRDNSSDSPTLAAKGAVRTLAAGAAKWSSSLFDLPPLVIPYRITLDGSGRPYAGSLDINIPPTDFLAYKTVPTPDRVRALVLSRTTHSVRGIFVSSSGSGSQTVNCFIDVNAYMYHAMLVNMQTGVPEIIFTVGVNNQTCGSRSFDAANNSLGPCFSPCDSTQPQPYLIGFAQGHIPTGADVIFGH